MNIYSHLTDIINSKGACYLVLIDPDKIKGEELIAFLNVCEQSGVDGFLIGGSLMMDGDFPTAIKLIKEYTSLPAIIFPGGIDQVSAEADAILYLSLVSGRNAEQLIGKHVFAAPMIRKAGIEPISTGYILVESGSVTTAEYFSTSTPIPRNKPEIAAATALAAQYMGMKFIYLEAGSGAQLSVPDEMVKCVSEYCDLPVIVGGGIRDPQVARNKVEMGAGIIVTGNFFEERNNWDKIKEFADAVHVNIKEGASIG